jgi:hypothetical protein
MFQASPRKRPRKGFASESRPERPEKKHFPKRRSAGDEDLPLGGAFPDAVAEFAKNSEFQGTGYLLGSEFQGTGYLLG